MKVADACISQCPIKVQEIENSRLHKFQPLDDGHFNIDKEESREETIDRNELEDGLTKVNEAVHVFNKALNFKLHEESGRMMVEVVNMDNQEVLKTVPPEEMLEILGKIREMVGLLIDEKI